MYLYLILIIRIIVCKFPLWCNCYHNETRSNLQLINELSYSKEIEIYDYYHTVHYYTEIYISRLLRGYSPNYQDVITLDYPYLKPIHSFRRKTIYPIKSGASISYSDIVRLTWIFISKEEWNKFNLFLINLYHENIVWYSNTINKGSNQRFKGVNIKYLLNLRIFNLLTLHPVSSDKFEYIYPIIEMQLQCKNHYLYQKLTHDLYKAMRSWIIIERNYKNDIFMISKGNFLEDNSVHDYTMLVNYFNWSKGKVMASQYDLFKYGIGYYINKEIEVFNKELIVFRNKFMIIKDSYNTLENWADVKRLKQEMNVFLNDIYDYADRKDEMS